MKTAKEVCEGVKIYNKYWEEYDLNSLISFIEHKRGLVELYELSALFKVAKTNQTQLKELGFVVTEKTQRINVGNSFFGFGKPKFVYQDIITISACCGEE